MRKSTGQVRDEVARRGAEHPEAERPSSQLADAAHRVPRPVDPREHPLGLGSEGAAGLGEGDAAADPREEVDAELGLELPHLLGERGLRDIERPGRTGERTRARPPRGNSGVVEE